MEFFKNRRVRTWGIYLLALLVITVSMIIINPKEGGLSPARLAIAISVIGAVLVPVALLAHSWRKILKPSQAYELKECFLDQDELEQAVALYVYSQQHHSIEGDVHFTLDDEGTIRCIYYLPQE